jgi:hypothetical protein
MFFLDGFRNTMVAEEIGAAAIGNEVGRVQRAFSDLHAVWEVFVANFRAAPFTEMLSQIKKRPSKYKRALICDTFSGRDKTEA